MTSTKFTREGLTALFISLVAVCTSMTASAEDLPSSGFIPSAIESKLEKVSAGDDREAKRWISTDLTHDNYQSIMIDRVIFYPAPNPGPQVSSSALEKIADYLTASFREHIGAKIPVVDQAGPGTLRMQPAITAVAVKKEGLSAKDVVPVHLLFSVASAAAGKMDQDVTAHVEVRLTDSVSGEYRAAVKLDLEGQQLENKDDQVTVDTLKAALDKGAQNGAKAIGETLQR